MSEAFSTFWAGSVSGTAPRLTSLLIKPVSAVCNPDCEYCFYPDREADPCESLPGRRISDETPERLVETWFLYSYPHSTFVFQGGEPTLTSPAKRPSPMPSALPAAMPRSVMVAVPNCATAPRKSFEATCPVFLYQS